MVSFAFSCGCLARASAAKPQRLLLEGENARQEKLFDRDGRERRHGRPEHLWFLRSAFAGRPSVQPPARRPGISNRRAYTGISPEGKGGTGFSRTPPNFQAYIGIGYCR